ncbi:hypothetical protein PybrP1_012069 [[Pythium] brassicae (nom. inval.)]|nr:hypothetical protein PybrP1_012069 [[Pythium] brassicae (nom. inval.)]
MEVLHSLPTLLRAQPEVQRALTQLGLCEPTLPSDATTSKLLVLDTVAFHFRHGFEDYSQRARSLDMLATLLHKIAVDFNIVVRRDALSGVAGVDTLTLAL